MLDMSPGLLDIFLFVYIGITVFTLEIFSIWRFAVCSTSVTLFDSTSTADVPALLVKALLVNCYSACIVAFAWRSFSTGLDESLYVKSMHRHSVHQHCKSGALFCALYWK